MQFLEAESGGTITMGHGWTFTDAPPEEAIFDLAYEAAPSADYFDIFIAAGWTPVLSVADLHIFKAAPGTPPVHTAYDSRRDELVRQRDNYIRYSAMGIAIFALTALITATISWYFEHEKPVLLMSGILSFGCIPVVYTVLPLLGYMTQLRRLTPDTQ
ncbi:DUF2812 domain-containing protein [Austwickia chelonae]|uniref:DUF2812 domain-containing protein n=1 Tax=Austwickia chelonae TaxID=100225 RepID=UPI00196895E5|nr:DUF2812 domain-containing protein [Austwickia chelonae]